MPWEIRRNYGGCSGFAVVKKPDGELEGCHSTVAAAESQMRALYASEGEMGRMNKETVTNDQTPNKNPQGLSASTTYEKIDKATSLDALDLKPTESMANNAKRGLELRRKFGRGGTSVGVARARDLANRKELSPETVGRMYSFFSRHEVDKKGKDFNNPERPSNGKIAWLLWGGDSGFAWARSKWGAIQRIRAQKSENAIWKDSALSFEKFIDIPE